MNVTELHAALDHLAGPDPDVGEGRHAVSDRVRRARRSVGMAASVLVILLAAAIIAVPGDTEQSIDATAPSLGARIHFADAGLSLRPPVGWTVDPDPDPRRPVHIAAASISTGSPRERCAYRGAGILIAESFEPAARRPPRFDEHSGTGLRRDAGRCAPRLQQIGFSERGRTFWVAIDVEHAAGPRRLDELYALLNSIRVTPRSLHAFCEQAQRVEDSKQADEMKTSRQVSREVARLRRSTPSTAVERALAVAEPVFRDPLGYGTAIGQQPLTDELHRAVTTVDDALQRCGLGTTIFYFAAR